ncbi:DUF4178 domain-containing protein [Cellulosimicrobium terreum]|nr:DUF4178 domain-containing protein [Cellulosimicrobium terreum]
MSAHAARLAMRVDEELVGTGHPPARTTPRAVAVLGTPDGSTWEEWQLRGQDGSDLWIEHDHDTSQVTLYEPVETTPPVVDMDGLVPGSRLTLGFDGQTHELAVRERGTGRILSVVGSFAEPFAVGQVVEYADLAGRGVLVSVERTVGRLGPTTSIYRGRRLDAAEQKRVFGRRLAPARGSARRISLWAVVVALVVGVFASCQARSEGSGAACTPRTVVTSAPDGTPTTTSDGTTCYRRSVYGGGGGGLGK